MKRVFDQLKYLWIIAVIGFIVFYFYKNYELVLNTVRYIPLFNLLIAFISIVLSKFLLSYVSLLSTYYFDKRIKYLKMFQIYNITQLAKYIPGSIWQFVGKAGAYSIEGLENKSIKKSILIEMTWVLFTSFLLGLIFIFISDKNINFEFIINSLHDYYIFYLLLIILVGTIFIFKFGDIKDVILIVVKESSINIQLLFTLLGVWILLGLSFFITLTPYIENISFYTFIYIVGLYALSYAIGFLVPFAPAGIGIREGILLLGISSIIVGDNGLVLASLNRVIYIVVELLIVSIYIKKLIKGKKI